MCSPARQSTMGAPYGKLCKHNVVLYWGRQKTARQSQRHLQATSFGAVFCLKKKRPQSTVKFCKLPVHGRFFCPQDNHTMFNSRPQADRRAETESRHTCFPAKKLNAAAPKSPNLQIAKSPK